ncbi:MAG: MFS transporter, partial [Alphaproteobacteria bacterium]|nr:MFS transporter [Alphaproteobacteria bacterium]
MALRASLFTNYLMGLGSWFVPLGIQMVLFPWLVAVVLHMDAFAVGIAQMALMAPSILFLPLGGLVADRGNPRRLLLRYHVLYALPPLALAVVLMMGGLSYPLLIAYGLVAGSIGAFAVPTRDALLPSVAKDNLPRAVALATALQFLGQLAGIALASSADHVGAPPLLVLNAALVLLGCIAVAALPDPPPHPPVVHPSYWRSIGDGVREALRSDQIWPVLLLNFGVGVFYVGPFMAILPLVVRDVYRGGAAELAYVNLAFWAGTIIAAVALAGISRRVTLRGRLVAIAVSVGTLVLATMATLPSFLALAGLCFIWGLGAGVTMTQSRTVIQIVAPATHRARLMSLFQLGLGGGGPIGAFL